MGLFDQTLFFEDYEGGLPDIKASKRITLSFEKDKLIITAGILNFKKIILSPKQIIEVGLNQQKYRSAGKAATGAVVGGLLTGGIGLLAGAALGGKRRTENNLHFVVEMNNKHYQVLFKPSKTTQKLYNQLVTFSSKADSSKQNENNSDKEIRAEKIDVVTELERLHSLVDKGILTQEEFELQKKKILS